MPFLKSEKQLLQVGNYSDVELDLIMTVSALPFPTLNSDTFGVFDSNFNVQDHLRDLQVAPVGPVGGIMFLQLSLFRDCQPLWLDLHEDFKCHSLLFDLDLP